MPTTGEYQITGSGWRKLAVLLLAVAAVGLPINSLGGYALLTVLAVVTFSGEVRLDGRAWLAALAIVAVAIAGQIMLAPPRIDEGHNVFLPGGPNRALEKGLPAEVYRHMAVEFDKQYPPAKRCAPSVPGCWLGGGFPDRTFAFSADGIFHKSDLSRSVTEIDFSDPVWLRLGFINEAKYNWYPISDVQRSQRNRQFWMGLDRWRLTMPWFEMIRLPAAMVGGELCWRGELMWEGAGEHFSLWPGQGCRTIEPADAGRRIVGIAIKPDSLAMVFTPPWQVRLLQFASWALSLAAAFGLVVALVRFKARRMVLPLILIGLSVVVVMHRRWQLHRRCTAVRRRRRWAVLRRLRTHDSAEIAGRGYSRRARRRRKSLLLRGAWAAVFPCAGTHRVRRKLPRLSIPHPSAAISGLLPVPPVSAASVGRSRWFCFLSRFRSACCSAPASPIT